MGRIFRTTGLGALLVALLAMASVLSVVPGGSAKDTPVSLFPSSAGAPTSASSDHRAVEVGVRFTTSVAGSVTALRYFEPEAGPPARKTGHLWSSSGELLASVTFVGDTTTGWKESSLATPVSLSPGATYVVSYFAPDGGYAHTAHFFSTNAVASGPLTAAARHNGVYVHASQPSFPSRTYRSMLNSWADLVFVPHPSTPMSSIPASTTTTATTATSTTPTTTTRAPTTSAPPTTTHPPSTGEPAPAFVACGPNRNSAMISPFTTFASGKAAFPNSNYVDLPAGDNSGVIGQNWMLAPSTTYYFEPGRHTIGGGEFGQIVAQNNDVFVAAPGAYIDGQSTNAYAFTGGATGVTIAYLEITHFMSPLDEGVVNHDGASNWAMRYDYMHDNGGAAMILGDGNSALYNCLDHNAQYGFQIFGDTVNVSFNEISRNNSANVESSNPGCGCSGGMKAWEAKNVVLDDNWVHDNLNVGLWIDTNNVGFDISRNVITDNTAEAIIYETSYNFHITNNYIARNAWVKGPENRGFPNPAIYISESGGDSRAGSLYASSEIANNTLIDNWGGITLWENANRYCAGAGGDHECTIVNPLVATASTCGSTLIASAPYVDDCRWKTKNVSVHDNTLRLTSANVPRCTAANDCGDVALVSQSGGCPSTCSPGDPYLGKLVEDNITFRQNNRFSNNTYTGPWRFEVHEQNNYVSFSTWKASPYSQDAGSVLTP